MSIESMMPSNHLILCRPLLLPPSIFSSIRVFSNESALCIRWRKYWSFSFSISPSNEHSGLISFRMDWLDLLAVQGTLKSLLQHHSSKASILWCSAFFTVQLSHPYMTIGKIIALTRWTFVGKVMSLLFNMLSRLVIAFFFPAFLPRSKHLLISWLQSPSAVILYIYNIYICIYIYTHTHTQISFPHEKQEFSRISCVMKLLMWSRIQMWKTAICGQEEQKKVTDVHNFQCILHSFCKIIYKIIYTKHFRICLN